MKYLYILALGLLTFCASCAPDVVRNAYVYPFSNCGYIVKVGGMGGKDINFSRCIPLADATKLAAQINQDMKQDWSGGEDR